MVVFSVVVVVLFVVVVVLLVVVVVLLVVVVVLLVVVVALVVVVVAAAVVTFVAEFCCSSWLPDLGTALPSPSPVNSLQILEGACNSKQFVILTSKELEQLTVR